MAQHQLGTRVELKAAGGAAAAPSGNVGLLLSALGAGGRTARHLLTIRLTGTGALSMLCYLWARGISAGYWGQLGDNLGALNNGAAIAGTTERVFHQVLENIGAMERVYLEVASLTGTGASVQAWLTPIVES